MTGVEEMKPRWKRAMAVPNAILSEAVGEIYVSKYFPAEDKVRMTELVKNLQVALGQHIDALEWMSDETKQKAQEKLSQSMQSNSRRPSENGMRNTAHVREVRSDPKTWTPEEKAAVRKRVMSGEKIFL